MNKILTLKDRRRQRLNERGNPQRTNPGSQPNFATYSGALALDQHGAPFDGDNVHAVRVDLKEACWADYYPVKIPSEPSRKERARVLYTLGK